MGNPNRPWNYGKGRPECDATEVPTELDIAWAAGIYEGEGTCQARMCSSTKRVHSYTAVNCSVSQKDSWLCPRLRSLFGGSVRTITIKKSLSKDVYYRWELNGTRAIGFLKLIFKYLSPRRQAQITAVFEATKRTYEYACV